MSRERSRPAHRWAAMAALAVMLLGGCPAPKPEPGSPPIEPAAEPDLPMAVETYDGRKFAVCRVDLRLQELELFWQDDQGLPFRTFSALDGWLRARGRRLAFATNAGMYMEDLRPVGLYVQHGRQLRPLNRSRGDGSNFCLLPNGVFALTGAGAVVVESSRYPSIQADTSLATQSGPMLVIEGELHPKFRQGSTSRLIRNGVGVVSPQEVVFAIAEEPVNFHEFATFFRDGLRCANALYLDGAISGVYAPALGRNDAFADYGPMLGVVAGP